MEKYLWPLKIPAKIVLARLPVSYGAWKKIGVFRHGRMDSAAYALKIFRLHTNKAFPGGLPKNFTALELGPGDSAAGALVAVAHGAAKTILADVGAYADRDISVYRAMAEELKKQDLAAPDLTGAKTFENVLTACRAEYLTGGLQSLQKIPSGSVDFIWSHSVLEHVRKQDFRATMAELARITKPEGRISHSIDLKDHLAQGLNNLRFSEALWESELFARSGFYTNRLRSSEILALIREGGLDILESDSGRWPVLPLPRGKMAAPFRSMGEDDLYIRTMHVVLRPAAVWKQPVSAMVN